MACRDPCTSSGLSAPRRSIPFAVAWPSSAGGARAFRVILLKATNVLGLPGHKRATSRRGKEFDPVFKCGTVSIQIWHRSYAFKNGPFKIGQRVRSAVDAIEVAICRHDRCGRGVCVPYPRYGESLEAIVAQIRQLPVGVTRANLTNLLRSGPARNALDCALCDLEAKHAGRRVWELAELNAPGPVDTMVIRASIVS